MQFFKNCSGKFHKNLSISPQKGEMLCMSIQSIAGMFHKKSHSCRKQIGKKDPACCHRDWPIYNSLVNQERRISRFEKRWNIKTTLLDRLANFRFLGRVNFSMIYENKKTRSAHVQLSGESCFEKNSQNFLSLALLKPTLFGPFNTLALEWAYN